MGQKKNAAAKRGAKKHEKAKKRQKKLAQRALPSAPRPIQRPEDAWRPLTEGIEGLARRAGISTHRADLLAEHLMDGHGRTEVAACWSSRRLSGMTEEAITAELALRGVRVDPAAFQALAQGQRSSTALAEQIWLPLLPTGQTPHDRDLLRAAAHDLWRRWVPDLLTDEEIGDLLEVAGGYSMHGHGDASTDLTVLLDLWARLRPVGGLARLRQGSLETRFLDLLCDGVQVEQDDRQAPIPALLEILAELPEDSEFRVELECAVWDSTDDVSLRDTLLDGDLAAAERDPTAPRVLLAGDLILGAEDPTPAQVARALAGIDAALAALTARIDRDPHPLSDLVDSLQYQRANLLKLQQEAGVAEAG